MEVFARVLDEWGRVDLLFSNAGLFGASAALDSSHEGAEPIGRTHHQQRSISAHVPRPHAVAYTATKHAITGLTKAISLEGRALNIARGQIDIGNAATDLSAGIGQGALQPDGSVLVEPMMDVRHAAQAVLYMAGLPREANVQSLAVLATTMPYIGRG